MRRDFRRGAGKAPLKPKHFEKRVLEILNWAETRQREPLAHQVR
jgi:hypothetical protein